MAKKKAAADRRCWLVKSEPDCYSIDDLKRDGKASWSGVRNYQARNLMRDDMKVGDEVLYYHSSAAPTGVAGTARVSAAAHPDLTALDPKDDHYDPKSTADDPIWMMVDVAFVSKFDRVVPLDELKKDAALEGLMVIARGSRLSVQPVSPEHYDHICRLAKKKG